MTTITWVLAADACRARIFETHGLKLDLQEIEDLTNPVSRSIELSDKDREKFARNVASHLEQARLQHRFDRLRLAVEPRFLGLLREHLSSETRKLVYEEVNHDISKLDSRGVERHLGRP